MATGHQQTIPRQATIFINKLEAARRQLDTAIRMTFANEDALAIHTLAAAAHGIVRDILRKRGRHASDELIRECIYHGARAGGTPTYLMPNDDRKLSRADWGPIWFKPFGLIFRPVSIIGWILRLAALAFCVHIFLFVDAKSHSVSDTFYDIFPCWVPTILAWILIANKTSGHRRG